eukprot:TRINITY_DN578_c0_g1_i1.p1 TRINITY_DN578_c0_g1~~TRINITY_DN578_c0_g1_i1.p1  ORF type:complete len:119 (+),score=9.38 TRINITY_DN578_c0_g1_i1:542-898(+)
MLCLYGTHTFIVFVKGTGSTVVPGCCNFSLVISQVAECGFFESGKHVVVVLIVSTTHCKRESGMRDVCVENALEALLFLERAQESDNVELCGRCLSISGFFLLSFFAFSHNVFFFVNL